MSNLWARKWTRTVESNISNMWTRKWIRNAEPNMSKKCRRVSEQATRSQICRTRGPVSGTELQKIIYCGP
jgi:hypothetical protein